MLAGDALRGEAEIGGRADHGFFELRDVPADVAPMLGQIQDRIADDLAGAVVGDVATAIAGMEFHVFLREQLVRDAQIVARAVAAEGDDVRMLAEEQHVGNGAGLAGGDELALQFVRRGVGDQAVIDYQQVLVACGNLISSSGDDKRPALAFALNGVASPSTCAGRSSATLLLERIVPPRPTTA